MSTIVLDSSDVVVGRTYRLEITAVAGSGASDIDVSYTAVTGDDAQKVMRGLRDAMIVQRSSLLGLQTNTIDVESNAGTMTLAATLQYGMSTFDFGIDETAINEAH